MTDQLFSKEFQQIHFPAVHGCVQLSPDINFLLKLDVLLSPLVTVWCLVSDLCKFKAAVINICTLTKRQMATRT